MDSLLEFINHLNTVHSTIKFTSDISPTETAFLDLVIYIKGNRLYIRLHTKTTDRHMYLNYYSEHPMSLKRSIPYSQFLRLTRIHSKPQYLLEAQTHMYFFFIWREYPHDIILEAWMKANKVTREQLLSQTRNNKDTDTPLMFITTYSSANSNFRELFSKHWSYLGRSSATRELERQDFMIPYRKSSFLRDMLVKAKTAQPKTTTIKGCNRPANTVVKSPNQGG